MSGAVVRPSVIAIDYDGTFTIDPDLWRAFIERAQARGHTVVMVTGRSHEGQWGAEVRREVRGLVPVVFAAQMWKSTAAQCAGYDVNVWIEDHPETISRQTLVLGNAREENTKCPRCKAALCPRHAHAQHEGGSEHYVVFVCPGCENDDLTRLARSVGK